MEGLAALALVAVALLSMVVGLNRAGQLLTGGIISMLRIALIGTARGLWLTVRGLFQLGIGVAGGISSAFFRTPKVVEPGHSLRPGSAGALPPTIADYSGLAEPGALRSLYEGSFPLGYYLQPGGSCGRPLGLPFEFLLRHCAVIGPTGAGKTESILVPWCVSALNAGQSVVLIDIMGNLYDRLRPVIDEAGAVLRYVALHAQQRSDHWNFFDEIVEDSDLDRIVGSLLDRARENDPQPYFHERDCRLLRALLHITHEYFGRDATPARLYQLCTDQELLREALYSESEIVRHRSEVAELLSESREEFSRAISGLQNKLHLFRTPALSSITADSTFRLNELWERPTLLIIGARLADGEAAVALSSCLLNMLFAAIFRRYGRPSGRALFLLIDEAPRLAKRIPYAEVLAVVRSAQVGVCLLAQDVVQFGDERAMQEVLANCATMLLFSGCKHSTAQYFSNRIGDRLTPQISRTQEQRAWWQESARPSETVSWMRTPVLGLGEIQNLPMASAVPRRYPAIVQVPDVSALPFLVDLTQRRSSH